MRPSQFELDFTHPLAVGLQFASLGRVGRTGLCFDSSLHAKHGVLTNMEPATDWVLSLAMRRPTLSLDGTNEWVQLPGAPFASWQATTPFTICCWGSPTANNGYRVLASNYQNQSPYDGIVLFSHHDSFAAGFAPVAYVLDPSGNYINVSVDASIGTGFHHVCAVNTGTGLSSGLTIYTDGVAPAQTRTNSGTVGSLASRSWRIGAPATGESTSSCFPGEIADVLLWNRTLMAPEIQGLASRDNVMLSGLIRPIRRRSLKPAAGGGIRRRRALVIGV